MGNRYSCDQEVCLPDGRKLIVVMDEDGNPVVAAEFAVGLVETLRKQTADNAALRAQVEELKENAKRAWEECHALSSELSKANQDRDRWRECAVYLDYRGADYCVAIHKELDGLQADNAEHREQMSELLKAWKSRATRAEAILSEQSLNIVTMTHMHDALRRSNEMLAERAEKAEAERDEARAKCRKWRPISEAPRDGTHILAWNGNRTAHHFDSHPPTVVHWFVDGFYPSVSEIGNQPAYQATVWTELDERPALDAALAECGEGDNKSSKKLNTNWVKDY
jgi:hypothetical protein